MAITIVPTTELNAVNEILTALGVMPVNTLVDVSKIADAAIALDTLRNVAREVQTRGWWFNSSFNVSITPSSNQILVGNDIIAIRPSLGTNANAGESRHFVQRNNKLFDLSSNSFTFNSAVLADIVYLLDFEELPESARRFITVRAAKITQTKLLGADSQNVFNEAYEADAWAILEGDEITLNPQSALFKLRAQTRHKQLRQDPSTRVTSNQQRGNYAVT